MIGIRVDANETIATGHLMRCLAIADELQHQVSPPVFLTTDAYAEQIIASKGYPVLLLSAEWNQMDRELPELLNLIAQYSIDKLFIDSYSVTYSYLATLQKHCQVIYLDDLNAFPYPVSMILNYSIYADSIPYAKIYASSPVKLLLGTAYAPLRSEFKSLSVQKRPSVSKILITAGGVDNYNVAGFLLKKIQGENQFPDIEFHVVVGKLNCHLKELEMFPEQSSHIILHHDVSRMAGLMTSCDLAVSAGGTTLYELSACGVPTVCFSVADNQLENVRGFAAKGIMEYAGDVRADLSGVLDRVIWHLKKYIADPIFRERCSCNMQKVVDGIGAERVASEIIAL